MDLSRPGAAEERRPGAAAQQRHVEPPGATSLWRLTLSCRARELLELRDRDGLPKELHLAPCMRIDEPIPLRSFKALQKGSMPRVNRHLTTTLTALFARSALFIFKALGFAKPDDLSLTAITHVDAVKCDLEASLGPKGLTRMALRFLEPSDRCALDLTEASGLEKSQLQEPLKKL